MHLFRYFNEEEGVSPLTPGYPSTPNLGSASDLPPSLALGPKCIVYHSTVVGLQVEMFGVSEEEDFKFLENIEREERLDMHLFLLVLDSNICILGK